MSGDFPEPWFTFACLLAGLILMILAGIFKNLAMQWSASVGAPLMCGALAGLAISWTHARGPFDGAVAATIALTLSAAWLYRRGFHSEPLEGFMRGAITGIAAAFTGVALSAGDFRNTAPLILAGGTAGVVLTFLRERWKGRTAIVLAISAVAAAAVWAAVLAGGTIVEKAHLTLAAAVAPSLIVITGVFLRWPRLRRELDEEARLGLFNEELVRPSANPVLRLFRGGWPDRTLRRRFVTVANELAVRKLQQRNGHPDLARIHQLDVFKLRTQLQDLARMRLMMERAEDPQAEASDLHRVDF